MSGQAFDFRCDAEHGQNVHSVRRHDDKHTNKYRIKRTKNGATRHQTEAQRPKFKQHTKRNATRMIWHLSRRFCYFFSRAGYSSQEHKTTKKQTMENSTRSNLFSFECVCVFCLLSDAHAELMEYIMRVIIKLCSCGFIYITFDTKRTHRASRRNNHVTKIEPKSKRNEMAAKRKNARRPKVNDAIQFETIYVIKNGQRDEKCDVNDNILSVFILYIHFFRVILFRFEK